MIRKFLGSVVLLSLAACGAAPEDGGPDVQQKTQALASDPNQYIFAVRRLSSGKYVANPMGDYTSSCPDGTTGSECTLDRLNLANTGLSSTRQGQLVTRIAAEPANELSASVLLKGMPVTVRDSRTNPPTSYTEFRASAAYWAPSVRAHGKVAYVVAGIQSNGYQPVKGVNSDLSTAKVIDVTYWVRFNWVGPSTERPSSYPADSFVGFSAYRPVDGASALGPYIFDADQRFLRVAN